MNAEEYPIEPQVKTRKSSSEKCAEFWKHIAYVIDIWYLRFQRLIQKFPAYETRQLLKNVKEILHHPPALYQKDEYLLTPKFSPTSYWVPTDIKECIPVIKTAQTFYQQYLAEPQRTLSGARIERRTAFC